MTALRGQHRLRPAKPDDFIFLKTLHESAMRTYVEAIWGWNADAQTKLFTERFDPSKTQVITVEGIEAGALSVEIREEEIFLASIMLMPNFQGNGLGSRIIETIKDDGASRRVPITLTVLKPNPAKSLYERLGFRTVREDEIRYYMEFLPP